MSRGLLSLIALAALVVLATSGGAQQAAFPWSEEVRLTDHPDSSFSDWPASVPQGYARTRDCLHVIWRDFMLRTSDCNPASERCWHYTHQIGWQGADWGGRERSRERHEGDLCDQRAERKRLGQRRQHRGGWQG